MHSTASATIQRELAVLLLAVAEALVVHLVLLTVFGADAYPLWLTIFIIAATHAITRIVSQFPLQPLAQRIVGLGSFLLMILVGVRWAGSNTGDWVAAAARGLAFESAHLWVTILLVGYAWWRSLRRIHAVIHGAQRMLRAGIVLCLVLLPLLALRAAWPTLESRVLLEIAGFVGLTVAGMSGLRTSQSIAERDAAFGVRWLLSVTLPVAGVIAIALLFTGIVDARGLDAIKTLIGPPLTLLTGLLDLTARVIGAALRIILAPFFWLGDWLLDQLRSTPGSTAQPLPRPPPAQRPSGDLPGLPDSVRYGGAAILLLAIVAFAMRRMFRHLTSVSQPVNEERSSVFSWSNVLANHSPGRRRSASITDDPLGRLRADERLRHTIRIRESYMALQQWGSAHGRRRRHSETAEQYRTAVQGRFADEPGASRAIDTLTDVYRQARYSGIPATDAEARIAERAAQTLMEHAPGTTISSTEQR